MSEQQDVDQILADDHEGVVTGSVSIAENVVYEAIQEVATALSATDQSLSGICATIEGAT